MTADEQQTLLAKTRAMRAALRAFMEEAWADESAMEVLAVLTYETIKIIGRMAESEAHAHRFVDGLCDGFHQQITQMARPPAETP